MLLTALLSACIPTPKEPLDVDNTVIYENSTPVLIDELWEFGAALEEAFLSFDRGYVHQVF